MSGNDNLDEAGGPAQASKPGADAKVPNAREAGAPTTDEAVRARREAGARREFNETVSFHHDGQTIEGWALNISRGGLRAILDESVSAGDEFEMTLGDSSQRRPVRVVWARQEKGGVIIGVAFLDIADGSIPPPPSFRPPAEPAPASAPPAGRRDLSSERSDEADES